MFLNKTLYGGSMKILRIINIIILSIFVLTVVIGFAKADTHTADSCSLSDVRTAIGLASDGDTVVVPKGACTWSDKLLITKAIRLQGAQTVASTKTVDDANDTIITLANPTIGEGLYADAANTCGLNLGTAASLCSLGITFQFKSGSAAIVDTPIEVTKFVFKQSMSVPNVIVVHILNGDGDNPLNKILIHDNLYNLRQDTGAGQSSFPLIVNGYIYGVFYNNTVYMRKPVFNFSINNVFSSGGTCWALGKYEWKHTARYTPGSDKTFFVEDNTFDFTYNTAIHMGGLSHSGSAVYRYNTFINQDTTSSGSQYNTDVHGAYPSRYPPVGIEYYGNLFQRSYSGGYSLGLLFLRTGKNTVFGNLVDNTGTGTTGTFIEMRRECDECLTLFGSLSDYTCPTTTTTMTGCREKKKCSSTGQPYYLNNTYIFQNRQGATGSTLVSNIVSNAGGSGADEYCPTSSGYTVPIAVREGYEYWKDSTSFNGTRGIGCGPLSAIQPGGALYNSCTTGTAYWATDQSCSQLTTANVGAGGTPSTKKQVGTLYRCGPTNIWATYYTPYTYPHPLRGEADTTAPIVSNVSPTTEQACLDESDPYTASSHAISFQTSENATCRYTIGTTEAYADLDTEMTGAGTASHSGTVALTCGQNSTIYYACTDGTNVSDTASWTFGVSAGGDTDPPILSSLTVTNQSCATTSQLVIGTSEPATCRYCKDDAGVTCNSATVWADRTQFSVTGGDTVHHEVSISQACSATETYNILCQDTNTNESSNLAVQVTTDAAKAMSITVGGAHTITLGTGSLQITVIP
jgi:hypothetical protein